MNKYALRAGALLLAGLLAACQTTPRQGAGVSPGVSVTRFHLGQEVARGEIRVEPANPAESNSLEFAPLAASVERELSRLGWSVAQGNARSEQVASVRVTQGDRGGSMVTELSVRIQRRSDATVAWEGRAELEARRNAALADRRAAVDRLAAALFQDFPGESGRTIRVR